MTLVLRAVALHGKPLIEPIEARFVAPGGTIGRSSHNVLTLPDPDRHISRTQVDIVVEDGGCVIKNIGSANPIMVRSRTLAVGESMPLLHGDRLRIGGYSLEVVDNEQDDNEQDDSGLDEGANGDRPQRIADQTERAPPDATSRSVPPRLDDWPVMDKSPAVDAQSSTSPGGFAAHAAGTFGFRDDSSGPAVNPFADLLGVPESSGSHNPLDEFLSKRGSSIDRSDAPSPASKASTESAWERSGPIPGLDTRPVPLSEWASQGLGPIEASLPDDSPAFTMSSDRMVPNPIEPDALVQAPSAPDTEAMWQAFCEGAGIQLDLTQGASPELMRIAGGLLRTAVDGTLQLIAVRSALRYELHAQVTVIKPRNNNPLKFATDPGSALEQLLQPPMRGFLPGPAAMTDVMNDLVGHAIGTMAGTRAALEGVLARFAPDQLEAQLTDNSVLDSVLPMNRKAKLWELYLQHYGSIRDEAQEDFHALFGKAFLEAYDQQLERLRREKSAGQG